MYNFSVDISNYTISNQIKPMQYEKESSLEQLQGVNFLLNPNRSLPNKLSKPRYSKFVEEFGFTTDTQILCNEFADIFLYNEQPGDRKTVISSPITKAWVDCSIVAGSLNHDSTLNFSERVLKGLQNIDSFVEQAESCFQSSNMLKNLFPYLNSSNVKEAKETILSSMSLIDLWNRKIITLRDQLFDLKASNMIATYNLYKYAFPMMFIFSEDKSVKQKQIAKSMFEQFQGSKEELRNNTPFVNQILADCNLEDSEIEQLYKEYVEKLEHSDKRTKKANLFNL